MSLIEQITEDMFRNNFPHLLDGHTEDEDTDEE